MSVRRGIRYDAGRCGIGCINDEYCPGEAQLGAAYRISAIPGRKTRD
jgi:hypothetical protein